MPPSNKNISKWQWQFWPMAALYNGITTARNKLYDAGIMPSKQMWVKTIAVGNLSVGGTGKTPHVAYLIELLQNNYNLAIVSRGYKRATKGVIIANSQSTAAEIGDEPMQTLLQFPKAIVAVGEKRVAAIEAVLQAHPPVNRILLDDGFQHRAVQADLYILLTNYHNRFTQDYLLPLGRLREKRSGYKRANVIVVSKCPPNLSLAEKASIIEEINPLPHQQVLFSYLQYHTPYELFTKAPTILNSSTSVLLLVGIAQPQIMVQYLQAEKGIQHLQTTFFPDHHVFTKKDLQQIKQQFEAINLTENTSEKIIVTTEKDATRLLPFKDWLQKQGLPIYCLPIEVAFNKTDAAAFKKRVLEV